MKKQNNFTKKLVPEPWYKQFAYFSSLLRYKCLVIQEGF